MTTTFQLNITTPHLTLGRAILAAMLALLLTACGGGGSVTVDAPASAVSTTNLRALPAEYLARKAVSYSPFRTATSVSDRDNEVITAAMVRQDLDLLVAGNFRLIRLFDSSDKVAKLVLDVIADNKLDIKVQLGAYVNSYKYVDNPYVSADIKAANQQELNRLVALSTNPKYNDIVLAVSVGNETMVVWSTVPIDPVDMASYIRFVRDRVTQPVTTDDNFLFFTEPPKIITDLLDFASIHTYSEIDTQYPESPYYYDWKQEAVPAGVARAVAMMDAAMKETRRQYQLVRDTLDRKGLRTMPIVIGETGWNAVDVGKLRFRAHPVNQKMYVSRLETWRAEGRAGPGPANVIYFEAFDEPWKGGDDKWGLFNVQRQARYVVQNLYPKDSFAWEPGTYTDADAVYFVAPTVTPEFTQYRYTIYSDVAGSTAATGLRVDAFDGNSVNAPSVVGTPPTGEGPNLISLTPQPKDYGWGLLWSSATAYGTENLQQFAAAGKINVWIKTSYAAPTNGKIEIGMSTLTADGDTQESYLQIGNGDYGYCNTNVWCQVSIPLQAFVVKNPKIDLRLVLSRFIIADRYSFTGKSNNSNITTPLLVDGIYWSK
jgi:exo-beta-1,3-glucanase (GH17 family)